MAKVLNRIGTLSVLRKELNKRNIKQFNSIKDINEFEENYEQQLIDIEIELRHNLRSKQENLASKFASRILGTRVRLPAKWMVFSLFLPKMLSIGTT